MYASVQLLCIPIENKSKTCYVIAFSMYDNPN